MIIKEEITILAICFLVKAILKKMIAKTLKIEDGIVKKAVFCIKNIAISPLFCDKLTMLSRNALSLAKIKPKEKTMIRKAIRNKATTKIIDELPAA